MVFTYWKNPAPPLVEQVMERAVENSVRDAYEAKLEYEAASKPTLPESVPYVPETGTGVQEPGGYAWYKSFAACLFL